MTITEYVVLNGGGLVIQEEICYLLYLLPLTISGYSVLWTGQEVFTNELVIILYNYQ